MMMLKKMVMLKLDMSNSSHDSIPVQCALFHRFGILEHNQKIRIPEETAWSCMSSSMEFGIQVAEDSLK